jgi:hypothetical protein
MKQKVIGGSPQTPVSFNQKVPRSCKPKRIKTFGRGKRALAG